jgi:hypothetical protein
MQQPRRFKHEVELAKKMRNQHKAEARKLKRLHRKQTKEVIAQ